MFFLDKRPRHRPDRQKKIVKKSRNAFKLDNITFDRIMQFLYQFLKLCQQTFTDFLTRYFNGKTINSQHISLSFVSSFFY
jgi:hypothetical protein